MRYFFKLFLSMVLILSAALAALDYFTVSFSLSHSYDREEESALSQHQMVKYSIQTSLLNSGDTFFTSELSAIGESASHLMGSGDGLSFADTSGSVYYDSLPVENDIVGIERGYTLRSTEAREDGTRVICVASSFTQNSRSFLLVTQRNVTSIFTEAEVLQENLTRLYFIVLGASTLVMLALSWSLTHPLAALRKTSRAFAEGDYSARSRVHTRDEVGELAEAYNQMADTIEEKILELEAAAQRQRDFTANFAHELKTPMTSIIGYADTLYQKTLSPAEVHQAAGYIVNEGMRLEALSFKLLELLTLERETFALEEAEISQVLQDAAETAGALAKKRNVFLSCRCEPGWVRLEYDLFKTLLLNLLDNALKSGGTRVTLSGLALGDSYLITISDNGRGIPEEELGRITEAFYMVDKSRSRKEHGAGLGLALAAQIAAIHGTTLDYASELGVGTHVQLSLAMETETDET